MALRIPLLAAEAVGRAVKKSPGGTGNLPVTSGNLPDETPARGQHPTPRPQRTRLPIAPGGSPGATGQWPVLPRLPHGRRLRDPGIVNVARLANAPGLTTSALCKGVDA